MAIRNKKKISSLGIVPGIRLELNPFAQAIGSARILRNFIPERGRLARKAFSPTFSSVPTPAATADVWKMFNFRYTRAGAIENELIVFRDNGRVYKVNFAGYENELVPGVNDGVAFIGTTVKSKPFVGQLGNRLFFSDGRTGYIYDGRSIVQWDGLTRSTTAPAVSAVAAGSLTAATGLRAAVTAVHLDEASNRVHESNRSDLSGFQVLSSEDLRIDKSGITFPARATHWSGYVSELDGSEILRRTNTTPITTDTFDVTALPAATDPEAPIRNDIPPLSSVGEVAKLRIFLRDDSQRDTFYFSALGEVRGLANGAPEESFPGHNQSSTVSSISDLSNSDFVPDRETRAILEHENIIFIFTERRTFSLIGEMNLLDDRVSRSLVKLQQFDEGTVGADSVVSTPFGVIFFSSGKKMWLWPGGKQLIDIGEPIQRLLDTVPGDSLSDVYLYWWSGNGRQWLVVALRSRDGESPDDSSTLANRLLIYDFSLPAIRPDRREPDPGSWFEFTDIAATAIAEFVENDGSRFLLVGDTNGDINQVDVIASPAHLNRSAILGKTYWGDTVQNNPAANFRTGLLLPQADAQIIGEYMSVTTGDHNAPGVPGTGPFTEPSIDSWVDVEDPDSPGTAIALTLAASARASGDKEAWLIPESGGDPSGALAKQFVFEARYAAGADDTGEADGRDEARINSIYKVAFNWVPVSEESRE